ncbi:oxidoreductase [Xanthomonas sacchari]|uniref:Oxidoreductase n=1 Tax=Xanthomonas sacchari TaxID=56458 RepID=A0AA46Y7K5_9XANT|nr:oxidoreductase [Xanthomonas sacchari]MCW0367505.1 putative oxidoreductase YdgJ [Xanthomonas sacchari]MCW0441642.1 putative oxidoreductase YdgJ [Xanthomonas sacchari]UYK77567.1 oxidoreductase [Xanthomonas sacchari]UYK88124.1 oxidoreductase [Xanthomonas sacchari]
MSDFNLALLGFGYVGRTFHAPLIAHTPGLHLHTVVSRQAEAVNAAWPQARVVADAAQAFADPRIDAVVIATPNQTHAPLALAALAQGKHVLVDKPFTLDVAEAQQVLAQAQRAGRIVSVFQNRRWDGDFLGVRALLEAGTLGEIAEFHSHFDRHRPQVGDRWREHALPGSGLWFDLGPHLLDQALQLFGPPQSLQADLALQRPGAQTVDYVHAVLRYPRLRVVLHAGSLVAANGLRFALHGSGGSYVKHGLDTQEAQLRAGVAPGAPGWGEDPLPGQLRLVGADGTHAVQTLPAPRGDYRDCYAAFREAIAGRAPAPVDAAQALAVMRLLEAGVRSAASGCSVTLD